MSVANPAVRIRRRSAEQPAGQVGMFVKMFDPPTASPPTPEFIPATNPVPEVMLAAGLLNGVATPHTWETQLLHNLVVPTWDNRPGGLQFFTFDQPNNPTANGTFPGPTVRVPRGAIFHSATVGKGPPPHTIHWHGIEPTPMNDGVGHCSMEIGSYTYQWQPNFMGFYFYHCHRNTVQHFEFGLYGALLIGAPDAWFSSLNPDGTTLNSIPIGAGRDGLFRAAANLKGTPLARLQTNFNPLTAPDPQRQFPADPHAHTVPYDVEALWVCDDRDSVWSDMASDPRAFFPGHGGVPGDDDRWFHGLFNDHNSDYWFITGVPVVPLDGVKRLGNTGRIAAGAAIPPALNGGVGANGGGPTQVSIDARVNDTILIRVLDAAYNFARVTFPADVVVIAFDGRALGVPPYGDYNHSFLLKKGTPILLSTARRFDCLMKPTRPMNSFAQVEFLDTQVRAATTGGPGRVRQIARIPIRIR